MNEYAVLSSLVASLQQVSIRGCLQYTLGIDTNNKILVKFIILLVSCHMNISKHFAIQLDIHMAGAVANMPLCIIATSSTLLATYISGGGGSEKGSFSFKHVFFIRWCSCWFIINLFVDWHLPFFFLPSPQPPRFSTTKTNFTCLFFSLYFRSSLLIILLFHCGLLQKVEWYKLVERQVKENRERKRPVDSLWNFFGAKWHWTIPLPP